MPENIHQNKWQFSNKTPKPGIKRSPAMPGMKMPDKADSDNITGQLQATSAMSPAKPAEK